MLESKAEVDQFLDDWTAALRSGKYKQRTGTLRYGDQYCCLGVACELLGLEAEHEDLSWWFIHRGRRWDGMIPGSIALTIQDHYPGMIYGRGTGEHSDGLADLNDGGWTFFQIADEIDRRRGVDV
jgi:hypothetical protein